MVSKVNGSDQPLSSTRSDALRFCRNDLAEYENIIGTENIFFALYSLGVIRETPSGIQKLNIFKSYYHRI
jgi:hypothetical protein